MPFKLNVNGRATTVDAPADMPLLWVVRDLLNLKGTKYGCGMSVCGMCTLHVDGVATRSCVTPVSQVEGKRITTIEGLSPDGSHPSAAALLAKTPKPTAAQIDEAMDGNLCRCGTYLRIRDAIRKAASAKA